jgi:hypothetical protein
VWCPARDLAAAPRPFVRLLGLTNRGPRRIGDDSILPNHILPASDFDAALSGSTSMLATKIYFELMVICRLSTPIVSLLAAADLSCAFRKLYPDVMVVQPGQDRDGYNDPGPLDCPT